MLVAHISSLTMKIGSVGPKSVHSELCRLMPGKKIVAMTGSHEVEKPGARVLSSVISGRSSVDFPPEAVLVGRVLELRLQDDGLGTSCGK